MAVGIILVIIPRYATISFQFVECRKQLWICTRSIHCPHTECFFNRNFCTVHSFRQISPIILAWSFCEKCNRDICAAEQSTGGVTEVILLWILFIKHTYLTAELVACNHLRVPGGRYVQLPFKELLLTRAYCPLECWSGMLVSLRCLYQNSLGYGALVYHLHEQRTLTSKGWRKLRLVHKTLPVG